MENEAKTEQKKCMVCQKQGCKCISLVRTIVFGLACLLIGTLVGGSFGHREFRRGDGRMMHQMEGGKMMMNIQMNHEMGMQNMMMDMTMAMKGKTGKELEKSFLTEMVPHHQGAVDMAKMIVADPNASAELKAFAQQIITAQEKEIGQMNEWLKKY
jgi:hypothetical protein